MKKISILLTSLVLSCFSLQAQNADDIIKDYIDLIGGAEAWSKLEGITMKASVNNGGMEIPVTVTQLKDGRQVVSIILQGQEFVQSAYDGEVMWSTNFQTRKAEKADDETLMLQEESSKDFPDALTDYKKKGYVAELIGEETIDGVETYKVKLTKNPLTIEGEEVENIVYYYFDKESNALIAQESEINTGPQKGTIAQTIYSDYQEVEGLYFAFSIAQGVKGGGSQPLVVQEVILNPEVEDSVFEFPIEEAAAE